MNISEQTILYILIGISIIAIASLIWNIRIERKFRRLMRGSSKNKSIEDSILSIEEDIKNFHGFKNNIEGYLTKVEKRLKRSIQGVHNINFKAFGGLDSGGGQSFATAFLDEEGNGIILSTLHSRDRVNVFSKKVKNFKPELALSEEEELALTNAKKSCKL